MTITTYLNIQGHVMRHEEGAAYKLEVIFNPEAAEEGTNTEWNDIGRRIRTSRGKMCHSVIPRGFLDKETMDDTFAVMLLYGISETRKQHSRPVMIGFALLEYDPDEPKEIYLNALCGNADIRNPPQGRRLSPGRILMVQLEWLARSMKFNVIKLSALSYVINYYRKLGFRHVHACKNAKNGLARKSKSNEVIEKDKDVVASARRFAKNKFVSEDDVEDAFLLEMARSLEMIGTSKEKLDNVARELTREYQQRDILFRVEDGKIVPYKKSNGKLDKQLQKRIQRANTSAYEFLSLLRRKGFAVECEDENRGRRGDLERDSDGDYGMGCSGDGYTMRKCLNRYAPPPMVSDPGPDKYSPNIKYNMSGGSKYRRTSKKVKRSKRRGTKKMPWAGWGKIAPKGKQRKTMRKNCGKKCFLGPKESFPVCAKGTCKVSKKGLWAAYIRAKQWGKKPSSYKGRGHPRHRRSVYKRVANKATGMLRRRGARVTGRTTKRRRR